VTWWLPHYDFFFFCLAFAVFGLFCFFFFFFGGGGGFILLFAFFQLKTNRFKNEKPSGDVSARRQAASTALVEFNVRGTQFEYSFSLYFQLCIYFLHSVY
jgi:hypothetical protein